ncbi:conserved hypothetical protein [Ricinus communis]|uniref:Serpin domain-containing protein n=1 Tax=Ricinus communis TaxID=3988 RepID=B9SBS7_RICCO|nr:conserved hypothetical protein [Ricinus communis]
MLNMVASGSKGRTLEQLLSFLESDGITHLTAQSSQIMDLTTTIQEFLESENVDDLNTQSLQARSNPSFLNALGGSFPSINREDSIHGHQIIGPFANTFVAPVLTPVGRFDNGNAGLSIGSGNSGPIISFVNGIWIDYRFNLKPSFKQLAEDVYKAKAESVDFGKQAEQVRKEVNLWAETATRGLIDNLLPPGFFKPDTILALANALYFKGTWFHTFDASRTRDQDFHLLDGRTVKAPFMISSSSKPQFYGSFEGFKLLRRPYKKGKDNKLYSVFIFLPDKRDGLKELVQKFNSDSSFLHENRDFSR